MKKIIDINSWKRKEHYLFFSDYNEPFFGITANVDCTKAYNKSKENKTSFFLYYMHKSLLAVNQIDEFHYRIEEANLVIYDVIHGSTTVANAADLFSFTFLAYHHDFELFCDSAKAAIDNAKKLHSLGVDENCSRIDVIHYSTIPWLSFTGLTHERNFARPDSIPKITFGKYFDDNGKLMLPMAVNAHHGLMDGLHVAKYFELFQQLLNE